MNLESPLSPIPNEAESGDTSTIYREVLNSLTTSAEYRHEFVAEAIASRITTQIRMMRERQDEPWDYKTFAEKMGKKVSWIYRLEDPNQALPTIPTLLQVGKAFDVALDIRFVPFSKLLREAVEIREKDLSVDPFSKDADLKASTTPATAKAISLESSFSNLHQMPSNQTQRAALAESYAVSNRQYDYSYGSEFKNPTDTPQRMSAASCAIGKTVRANGTS